MSTPEMKISFEKQKVDSWGVFVIVGGMCPKTADNIS